MKNDLPILTLEMRIQPMVRQMVQHMLLSEGELQEEIVRASEEAVANFDWRKNLKDMVQNTLRREVESLMHNLVSRLQYDQELRPLFVKMLTKIVEEQTI